MNLELILEIAADQGMLIVDNFDDAIIGLASRCGQQTVIAYSVNKILDILMDQEKLSYEEALDHFSFNIEGQWIGEMTPIFVHQRD